MKMKTIMMFGLVFGLVACGGDVRAPSDANFTKAIEASFEKQNPLCYIVSAQILPSAFRKEGKGLVGADIKQMTALATAGLLTVSDTFVQTADQGLDKPSPALSYDLTPLGSKFYKSDLPKNQQWVKGGGGFCFGTAEVEDIEKHSDMRVVEADTITDVSFTYRVKQAEAWTEKAPITEAFPEFVKAKKGEASSVLMLAKGIDGWSVIHPDAPRTDESSANESPTEASSAEGAEASEFLK